MLLAVRQHNDIEDTILSTNATPSTRRGREEREGVIKESARATSPVPSKGRVVT